MCDKYIPQEVFRLIEKESKNCLLPITAIKIDNTLKDLQTQPGNCKSLQLVDMSSSEGTIIYRRSVLFLLMTSLQELFPDAAATVEYSMNNGIYCRILPESLVTEENIKNLSAKMRKLTAADIPIIKHALPRKKAVQLFLDRKQKAKADLINSLEQPLVSVYTCRDYCDYLYGPMLACTGQIKLFAIDHYAPGIVVRTPDLAHPQSLPRKEKQKKLSVLLAEADRWSKILHCDYVSNLNDYIKNNHADELIRISEALQEKKIANIADDIASNKDCRVIFIAGPSSSGKTTFAQRLRVQLLVNGLRPVSLSMDNYFLDREHTPLTDKGEYDFETFEALDIKLLSKQIKDLIDGKGISVPRYNFVTGHKEWSGQKLSLLPDQPIIIEGIHGLNPNLTKSLPKDKIYKIYVSALTQLGIDSHNNIPTTMARLIRRIVRDYQFRGSSALKTIRQWPDVRAGEGKNIFPYQENADIMFNSALIYELAVLKKYAYPLLEKISEDIPEHSIARQLLDFLTFFRDIPGEEAIPNNSILREFIGKSCFF